MFGCSSLNYYDVQKVNIRCKAICDQWNLLAKLAIQRREELEVRALSCKISTVMIDLCSGNLYQHIL